MKYLSQLPNITCPSPRIFDEFDSRLGLNQIFKTPLSLSDVLRSEIIVYRGPYTIQGFLRSTSPDPFEMKYDVNILDKDAVQEMGAYYVPKLNRIFTEAEIYQYISRHPSRQYMLVPDSKTHCRDVYALVDSQPNNLTVSLLSCAHGGGRWQLLGTLRNKEGTDQWEDPVVNNSTLVATITPSSGKYFLIKFRHNSYDTVANFTLFNERDTALQDSQTIINRYLNLPGCTRIAASVSWHDIEYNITKAGHAKDSIVQRYGITREERYYYGSDTASIHTNLVFGGVDMSKETQQRVYSKIQDYLEKDMGNLRQIGRYGSYSNILVKSMLVIDKPLPWHRRPTYHFVQGLKHGGNIDIVELCRGELQIKDMTPVDVYYLHALDGKYIKISDRLFGSVRNTMVDSVTVDEVSFAEWNEQKGRNPELLKAIAQYTATTSTNGECAIGLNQIKIFNRLKFGALFCEQLIKTGYVNLAMSFANYVNLRADNMNYDVGSLQDILPGSDFAATNLMGILQMKKPVYQLLFDDKQAINTIECFQKRYRVIKRLMPDGIVTTETRKQLDEYLSLDQVGWTRYTFQTGNAIDLIDYPQETRSIYKMRERIQRAFGNDYDALRHYKEILQAYFQFKDIGWEPADFRIFIEFGVNPDTPAETRQMLIDREHAANTALAIYKTKLNEAAHKHTEAQYASRIAALRKLIATADLAQDKDFGRYTVRIPSQIYGEETVDSVEREGALMDHCVFRSYATSIAEGRYTILYLRDKINPAAPLVTIGITSDGRINQTYSKHDNSVNAEQAAAIVAWAKSKPGLVTFQAEGRLTRPGGWCYDVPLPELAPIDKNWLTKLATVTVAQD